MFVVDDRRLLLDVENFNKRMKALRQRIAELEEAGELREPLGFLARDALVAWASGENRKNWRQRSAVTDSSIDRLKEMNIWPWEIADSSESAREVSESS